MWLCNSRCQCQWLTLPLENGGRAFTGHHMNIQGTVHNWLCPHWMQHYGKPAPSLNSSSPQESMPCTFPWQHMSSGELIPAPHQLQQLGKCGPALHLESTSELTLLAGAQVSQPQHGRAGMSTRVITCLYPTSCQARGDLGAEVMPFHSHHHLQWLG